MNTILAPTRGGEASYPNQDLVIRVAKERGARLIFMYVSDIRFLENRSVSYLRDLETNLAGMGEFILTMAQERAEQQGVEAERRVLTGHFGAAVRTVARDEGVDIVFFGEPAGGTGHTNAGYLDRLAADLAKELGMEVYLADAGEIVARVTPDAGN